LSTHGDADQGFRIEDRGDALLITAWGFWSAEFVPHFLPTVMAALEAKGKGGALTMDLKDLRPLRDEGQQAFKALIIKALAYVTGGVELKGASALTKLQMLRLTRDLGAQDRVRVT
jgi:hypothetical protein